MCHLVVSPAKALSPQVASKGVTYAETSCNVSLDSVQTLKHTKNSEKQSIGNGRADDGEVQQSLSGHKLARDARSEAVEKLMAVIALTTALDRRALITASRDL